MKKIAVCVHLLLLTLTAAGRAQGKDPTYQLGPRDLIAVRVDEDAKLNGDRRVAEDGTVNLPLLGDVPVAGKTTAEVTAILKKLWEARYMQRASVDVQVLEFRSRPISVIGAVKQPGNLGFSGHWTLLEAIAAIAHAGGLTDRAASKILVKRASGSSGPREIFVDYKKILAGKEPDLELRQGDVVAVKESFF